MKKSKVRNLTKTLAVVSLLAPASSYSLGIGEIKLHSALNQNLNAEIALTLSGESVSDIKVNLASPEKFDQAGVSWTYFLSQIKFETITQSNGSAVIKLTSKEALKEPFLDFLLEVSWPKGNLYREFTVLVDPPSVYNQPTAPAASSAGKDVQAAAVPPQRQVHANGQASAGEYGPTLEKDTLWSVAERARGQNDFSVEQMIMAIYEANPQAFYKENVYALMSKKILKIPEREAVLKLSRNQALAEFNRHTKAWKDHSAPVRAETAKEKPAPSKAEGAGENQLTLLAPTKAAVNDHAVVTPANEQASVEKKAADTSKKSKDKSVLGEAEGAASTAAPADSAIQSKVAELEKQLAIMQELIALKDQQLAALQKQAQANPVVQDHAAPSEVAAAKPADQAAPIPQQAAAQPDVAVQPTEPAQPIESVQPAKPVEPVQPAKPIEEIQPPKPKPVAVVQPVQPVLQPESDNLYYLGVGGVGTTILALLGWLLWRKRKVDEETNTESMFASTMIKMPEADESLSVPIVEEDLAVHNIGTVDESSFLSEFTPSDFDSFDTDQGEIDPISEADVYLAYGRYQQAEELIRQAIKDQPNRDECKLKLLEIFYANENNEAFEAYANELVEAGKRNEAEFWEKAAEMGREICPESSLFSSGDSLFAVTGNSTVDSGDEGVIANHDFSKDSANIGAASFEESEPDDGDLDKEVTELNVNVLDSSVDDQRNNADIDFDLSAFAMDAEESDGAGNVSADPNSQIEDNDFDLSAFATDAKESNDLDQAFKAPNIQPEEIDFDLSSFSIDTKEPDETDKNIKAPDSQIESLDFDLSLFSTDAEEADETEKNIKAPGSQIEELDFDLSSFSMNAKESGNVDQSVIAPPQIESIDFDLSAFSMDAKEETNDADKSINALDTQIESIDFDLSLFSTDAEKSDGDALAASASTEQVRNKKQEFESYEFDFNFGNAEDKELDELDFSALGNGDKNGENAGFSGDGLLNLDDDLNGDFDFNFDLDMPLTTGEKDSNQYDEFGVSDLTDMDELETKLDLAKAYVDMGDADAAKDIAREVLEQGSADQKRVAQALLDELN